MIISEGLDMRFVYDDRGRLVGTIVYRQIGDVLGWVPMPLENMPGVIPMTAERAAQEVMINDGY